MKTALTFFWDEVSQIPKTVKFEDQAQAIIDLYNRAKAMEKEQITAAYRVGKVEANLPPEKLTTGEQYYNETYGKDERAKNESLF